INWQGHKCPDCAGEIINPVGTISSWSRCGICHRLMCVGSAVDEAGRTMITCPWCGAKNRMARVISLGDKVPSPLRGEYTTKQKESLRLPGMKSMLLDDKKKGHT
ncbi:MAG TPA: Com family DNA-binding transcriptional regulator, partial [Longilinea sp.]|nr:Com family DNA-binding transcriptional regulator [Longilinea sp.]